MKKIYRVVPVMVFLAGCSLMTTPKNDVPVQVPASENALTETALPAEEGAIEPIIAQTPLEKHAEKLELRLQGSGIQLTSSAEQIQLILPGNSVFLMKQATIKPAFRSVLTTLSAELKAYPEILIQIVGYTDDKGEAAANQALSLKQAAAVAEVLKAEGVPEGRILTDGLGGENPIASNATAAGREKNRRIEITLINLS